MAHCQVLPLTRRNGLPYGDVRYKRSCSKYGEAALKCIITELILGPMFRYHGEAGNLYQQTEEDLREPEAISPLIF